MFTTQFHVKEQAARKPTHGRNRRQDEGVSKKVLDIDRRFIDACSAYPCALCVENGPLTAEHAEIRRGSPRRLPVKIYFLCKAARY
jgi:hypothetical protein